MKYRGFDIKRTYPMPPIPSRQHDWTWVWTEYDGPECQAIGTAPSLIACLNEVDEFLDEFCDDEERAWYETVAVA